MKFPYITDHGMLQVPAEGEFPPNYRTIIVYDPDIRMDGNPNNDDYNVGNKDRSRSGTGINDLFH